MFKTLDGDKDLNSLREESSEAEKEIGKEIGKEIP